MIDNWAEDPDFKRTHYLLPLQLPAIQFRMQTWFKIMVIKKQIDGNEAITTSEEQTEQFVLLSQSGR